MANRKKRNRRGEVAEDFVSKTAHQVPITDKKGHRKDKSTVVSGEAKRWSFLRIVVGLILFAYECVGIAMIVAALTDRVGSSKDFFLIVGAIISVLLVPIGFWLWHRAFVVLNKSN